MDCRQAFELDLAEFLAAPREAHFDAFRAHYPRCEACSAEVGAWTELHAQLAAVSHPAAEVLAGYAQLPEVERARIDAHTAGCPACREELRLLEAFDPSVFAQPAALAGATREANSRGWFETLSGVLWHPAFAYGLAILVVVPVLWRTQGPGSFREPGAMPSVAVLEERAEMQEALAPPREAVPSAPAPAVERVARGAAAPVPTAAASPSLSPAAAPELALGTRFEGDAVASATPHSVVEPSPARSPEFAARKVAQSQRSLREPAADFARSRAASDAEGAPADETLASDWSDEAAPKASAGASRAGELAGRVERADQVALADSAPRTANEFSSISSEFAQAAKVIPARLEPVVWASAPRRVEVALPVAPGEARALEVVVEAVGGERRVTQSAQAEAGRAEVTLEFEKAWLTPGEYVVTVRDADAPVRSYALPVVER